MIQEQANTVDKPEDTTTTPPLWQLVLPVVTWLSVSGIACVVLASFLWLWIAVPLGLLIGTLFFAGWLVGMGGASTVQELNIASFILLVLMTILIPVFMHGRDKARQKQHKTQTHEVHLAPGQGKQ